MWILIASGEYAEVEFGDATKDIYYYRDRRTYRGLISYSDVHQSHHQLALRSHAVLPSVVS